MSTHELSPVAREISRIWLFKLLPLGPAVLAFSRPSSDSVTQESISWVENLLKSGSVLVGDAHNSKYSVDMMSVAAALALQFSGLQHMAGAIASKWTGKSTVWWQAAIGEEFLRAVNSDRQHLHLYPVTRYEDAQFLDNNIYELKQQTNRDYFERMNSHMAYPHTLGVLAPLGSRRSNTDDLKVKQGFINLSRRYPTVFSTASWHHGFEVYLSPVRIFSPQDQDESIRTQIESELKLLNLRAGYTHVRANS